MGCLAITNWPVDWLALESWSCGIDFAQLDVSLFWDCSSGSSSDPSHHGHSHHGHSHHGHSHDSSPVEVVFGAHHDCESCHVVYQGTRRNDSITLLHLSLFHDLTATHCRDIRPALSNQRSHHDASPAVSRALARAKSQVFLL